MTGWPRLNGVIVIGLFLLLFIGISCRTTVSDCNREALVDALYLTGDTFENALQEIESGKAKEARVRVDGILIVEWERIAFATKTGVLWANPGRHTAGLMAVHVLFEEGAELINAGNGSEEHLEHLPSGTFLEIHGKGVLKKTITWDGKSMANVDLIILGDVKVRPLREREITCLFGETQ